MPSQDRRQASIDDVRDRRVGIEDAMHLHVIVATVQCMVINVMAVIEMATEAMHIAVAAHLDVAKARVHLRTYHFHHQGQRTSSGTDRWHQDASKYSAELSLSAV
jgi:hypothetical protein